MEYNRNKQILDKKGKIYKIYHREICFPVEARMAERFSA